MTVQTFIDSAHDGWYVPDLSAITVGEREFLVPACSSSVGDTLVMVLYKEPLFPGGGRDQTGTYYGLNAPGDGWIQYESFRSDNGFTGSQFVVWVKESDGAQGSVLLQWPSPTWRSSQVIFGAMLAYSAADGFVNPFSPGPDLFDWYGAGDFEFKWTNAVDTDMSFDETTVLCILDQTVLNIFEAQNGNWLGPTWEHPSMAGAIGIDAAINERIRWDHVGPVDTTNNALPIPREIVIGDELGIDGNLPARTNTQLIQELGTANGQPADSVTWTAWRSMIYGIPDPTCVQGGEGWGWFDPDTEWWHVIGGGV